MSDPKQATSRSILPLLAVALGCLAIAAPFLWRSARGAQMGDSLEALLSSDERSKGGFEKLESLMTRRVALLVLMRSDDIFSDVGAALVDEVGRALDDLEGVPRIYSLTRAERPVRAPGFHLNPSDLIEFQPFLPLESTSEEDWRRIESQVLDYPWARDLLVSSDGSWTMVVAEVERPLVDHAARTTLRAEVQAAMAPFRERVDELHIGAFPFIEAEIRDDIEGDVRRFLLLLPILLALILLVTFRSAQVLLCVLVFEALGVGLLPVIFSLNGASINVHTGILFPLAAGLQLTFLTHFFASLRWAQGRGLAFRDALRAALGQVLRPSIIAALTTIVGLLSLLVCDVALVRDFGRLGAQAVLGCFLATFLPAIGLSLLLGGAAGEPESLLANVSTKGLLARLGPLVAALGRRRRALLVVAGLFVLASLPAVLGVRTDLRAIEFLGPTSASRQAMGAVDAHMGGMNLFELEVDCADAGGIQEPGNLRFLERLERFALDLPEVSNVYGYAQVYGMLNEIWNRGAEGSRRVPESPSAIAAMGMVVHGQDFLFQDSMFDAERTRTTLFIRTRDMPAARYLDVLREIEDFAEREHPAGVVVGGKAGLHSVLESDRRIVSSQVQSILLCVLAVFAILCLLWRSPRLACVALLTNLPALAVVLALHGYGGIPLNSVTVMVGAVVLGIAVDNGIHVLSFWSQERGRFDDPLDALRWVLAHKLGPMACTTAVLVSGFGLFLLSTFPPIADFGVLSMLALSTGLVSTALVLPALLLVAYPPAAATAPAPAAPREHVRAS